MFASSRRVRPAVRNRGGGLLLVALAMSAACVIGGTAPVSAQSIERGRAFARANCATCHSLDRYSLSPLRVAPPFRDLHKRYPVESLEEALAEGIVTGHPTMPEFRLDPGQVGDFIAFLKSLE